MSEYINNTVRVDNQLFPRDVYLETMDAQEALAQPYRYRLVVSTRRVLPPETVGTTMCLAWDPKRDFAHETDPVRYFHGYVTSLAHRAEFAPQQRLYEIELRPWLWMLGRTSNARIFQKLSVPAIVEKVFKAYDIAKYDLQLTRSYELREFCVQYRETDLAFVSRLLEEEGIYYYFRHARDEHTLVLVDDKEQHALLPGYGADDYTFVPDYPADNRIQDWNPAQQLRTAQVALKDYNFKKPTLGLTQIRSSGDAAAGCELFDYPGGYQKSKDGGRYAALRLEEEQAGAETVEASSKTHGIVPGFKFTFTRLDGEARRPILDAGTEYLVVSARYELDAYAIPQQLAPELLQRQRAARPLSCTFTALPASVQYRPARTTPRPRIAGVQTARVVGPKGEEIWTDAYGRVKVQFHWDREGELNENSSCWIRVAQIWASRGWGSVYVPRIDQEVVVAFLEGDPDRPLIVGCVYNGMNLPPRLGGGGETAPEPPPPAADEDDDSDGESSRIPSPLPDRAHISGLKTDSLHNTGGYNELSFDDQTGSELILLRAQKNWRGNAEANIDLQAKEFATVDGAVQLALQSLGRVAISAGPPMVGPSIELVGIGTIASDGALTHTGAMTIVGPLTVTGPVTVTGPITITGVLTINGTLMLNGKPLG
jgi:type VI secretion system secreted protein VgrG